MSRRLAQLIRSMTYWRRGASRRPLLSVSIGDRRIHRARNDPLPRGGGSVEQTREEIPRNRIRVQSMVPQRQLDGLRWGVATASLGMSPSHRLEDKFAALQKAGIMFCEVGVEGFITWARGQHPEWPASTAPFDWAEGGEPDPSDDELWQGLYSAAPQLVELAKTFDVKILGYQPLNQFEGWPAGHAREDWSRKKAEKWLPLCAKLGVEFLQVGSNDQSDATADDAKAAEDLKWLAELASQQTPPVKIAYESWCFSHHFPDWERTWRIVQLGDHANLGLCIDTAHPPLAPEYGFDPTTGEGWTELQYQAMLDRLREVPANKIVFVELSDLLHPKKPLGQGSLFDAWRDANKPPRGDRFTWAVCGRPVPLMGRNAGEIAGNDEDFGKGRVAETLKVILDKGWSGPVMFEPFEAQFMAVADPNVPMRYAAACSESSRRLLAAVS